MILPALLLQKPSKNSKAKEHLARLEERMQLWSEGHLNELLQEGRKIQQRLLVNSASRPATDNARIFAKLMFQGKVNTALKFISSDCDNGVLELSDDVMKDLGLKHPPPAPILEES